MKTLQWITQLTLTMSLFLIFASTTYAQLTVEELAEAVDLYVQAEAKGNDGYLVVKDDVEDKELKLKLEKIHKDKLTSLSEELHFVCADFKSTDGVIYDVDIFMKGKDKNSLTTTKVKVHKKEGEPRYTWYEDAGVWKTKDVAAKATEHPEHPKNGEHPEHPKNGEHPEHPEN